MKRTLSIALLAASAAALTPNAFAQTYSETVRTAPPAPRPEAVPKLVNHHFWSPGYWKWDGHQYQWVPGHLEQARPGYAWTQPQWQRYQGGWRLREGGWHPTVAVNNARDKRAKPANPATPAKPAAPATPAAHDDHPKAGGKSGANGGQHRTPKDRDHDGVPDRRDSAPDNPQVK